jgi:hypothetical protein
MIDYIVKNIDGDVNELIQVLVKNICKENRINYEKQNYKLLFSNEKLLTKNNNVKFTSGSKKYLCFYGKAYLNKKGKIVENIYLPNGTEVLEPRNNDLLIMCGGLENSTVVESSEELLHFYVAPGHMIRLQDPLLWQNI